MSESKEQTAGFDPFEQVDHTADLAYIARGRTEAELFEHAAATYPDLRFVSEPTPRGTILRVRVVLGI